MNEGATEARTYHWTDFAACYGEDLTLFYGPAEDAEETEREGELEHREARAKSFCSGCLVRAECLDDALRTKAMGGIWGGLTDVERRAEHRRRRRRRAA